jgi:dTDP-4-dehydrorhamnose reductase
VTFSSDLVFDGRLGRAYVESDPVNPGCVYGASKADAERRVGAAHPGSLIVRTSAFFGPWDRYNFIWAALNAFAAGRTSAAGSDVVSPTYVPDLVHVTLDLLIDGETGVWHLATPGAIAWRDLATDVAQRARFDTKLVQGVDAGRPPLNTAMTSERGVLLPPLGSALDRFFRDCEIDWAMRDDMLAVAAE